MDGREGISITAVGLALVGGVAVYGAVKGVGLGSGLRTLLGGQAIQQGEDLTLTTAGQNVADNAGKLMPSGPGDNTSVAVTASNYVGAGHVYRWGGGNPNGWDCSGFCNWVIGHDIGWAIPGYLGGFDGSSHGPVTGQWALWSGAATVPREQAQAGDLAIWPAFHMGIVLNSAHMVACPGPNGTPAPVLSTIDGAASGPLLIRRLLHKNVPSQRFE